MTPPPNVARSCILAALVVELYKDIGAPRTASDIADYLKDSASQIKGGLASNNNEWGKGFIKLPCRPVAVTTLPFTSESADWRTTDCESTRHQFARVDYYTFYSDGDRRIKINLESGINSYLFLIEGIHNGGTSFLERQSGSHNNDASIARDIGTGVYTVAVTTRTSVRAGTYTLKISNQTATPTVTPTPTTLENDGKWIQYALTTTGPIKVVANPTGTTKLIEIASSTTSANYCPPEQNDSKSFSANGTLHLAGCVVGTGKVEIRDAVNDALIETYNIEVAEANPTWDATLDPVPGTMQPDGSWNTFEVDAGGDVKVVVNPSGTARLGITTSSTASNPCSSIDNDDSVDRSDGNNVYIAGCVSGTGTIEIRRKVNDSLVRTYTMTVASAAWGGTLDLDPTTVTFTDDGSVWHSFEVESGGDIDVVVNPTGTVARMEISTSSTSGNFCGAESNDTKQRSDGHNVYLAGCVAGEATIQLIRRSDNTVARTYKVTIVTAASQVCNPLRNFDTARRTSTSVYVSWDSPLAGGAASTGRSIEIEKWANSRWNDERVINQSATSTSAWHLGLDARSWYTYRGKNVCGNLSSGFRHGTTKPRCPVSRVLAGPNPRRRQYQTAQAERPNPTMTRNRPLPANRRGIVAR